MKDQASVSVRGDTLYLSGEIGFNTIAKLQQQIEELPRKEIKQLNCGGITQSDSAAVSLLLYLLKDNQIVLQDVNKSLQGLLDLYGVNTLFNSSNTGR